METKTHAQGKKGKGCRILISCSLILILTAAIFAFAYILSAHNPKTPSRVNSGSRNYLIAKLSKAIFNLAMEKLRQPLLPMISAADNPLADWACCEKNNNGAFCTYRPQSECNSDFRISPNECEETEFCKPGCCIGSSGICNPNTPKSNCNGQWFEQSSCYIQECRNGCCILGSEARWITENQCEVKSGELGLPLNFKNEISSEIECLYLAEKDAEGACVLETQDRITTTRNCIFLTSEKCRTRNGEFYANVFCSNPSLNTTCTSHASTNCLEGKDEVYWFDSCGNREEVKRWCSIFLGTRCGQYRPNIDEKPDTGDYVCRDLSCNIEINGKIVNKKNGESWCEYEGCIGEGKDPVGSRHIRHICYMGEEKTEACDDYRNQICVQSDTDLGDGKVFSEASCRVNRWRSCYEYNNEKEGMAEKCNENPDCMIKGIHIDKFSFDVCVPNYPPGFQFWRTDDASRSGEIECSFATQTCPVVYVKRIKGWKCEVNCECEKAGFTQQMNELCTSLGDCGGYINFNGDYSDEGYSVKRSPRLSNIISDSYESCAEFQENQKPAEPGDFSFSQILGIPEDLGEGDIPEFSSMHTMLGAGVGALQMMGGAGGALNTVAAGGQALSAMTPVTSGILSEGAIYFKDANGLLTSFHTSIVGGPITITPTSSGGSIISSGGKTLGSFKGQGVVSEGTIAQEGSQVGGTGKSSGLAPGGWGNALASVGAALSVSGFLQAGFGMDAGASYAIGGVVGVAVFFDIITINPLVFIGLAILQFALGLGKTKMKYVSFTCSPWQAPSGGLNCDLCNTNDELGVPCSEYRCKSLGQTCELINQRTEDQKCINNNPNDVSSPRIKPLYKNISEGYQYAEVSDSGFEIKSDDNNCVPEYTFLNFGIETDKPAQCKISESVEDSYEEMPEFFGGKNSYIKEHEMTLVMPSPSAFKNRYELTDEEIEAIGNINYFIKCQSVNGISNTVPFAIKTCVKPGPDLTAPRITKVSPENNGFIKHGATEQELMAYINEPADCRYSNENKNYNEMENSMTCFNDLEDYGLYGWLCTSVLNVETDNKFYIKCRDQPWLPDDNESRNTMAEAYQYSLQLSKSQLVIEDFRPENNFEIWSGVEPVSFELKVKTSGGADSTSNCGWEGNGYSDDFPELNEQYHSYTITSGKRGTYNIKFICEDRAGNTAEARTSFKVSIDNSGPRITRIFYDGNLKIITDEEAECRYGFNSRFAWENSTIMSGNGLEHSADWQLKTYYVQCMDNYGNKGGKSVVKAYSLI